MEYIQKKFDKIRLIPEDRSKRSQFWQYRLQDIQEMTFFNLVVFAIQFALSMS